MNIFKKTILSIITTLIFSFGILAGLTFADSYSGTVFGRASYYGYFDNKKDTMGTSVLPVISAGLAIPDSYNTVDELLALLKSYNDGSDKQKKTGSAFIVNTMLGRDGPGNGRDVSDADWNILTTRLKDREARGKITWTGNVNNDINSYYQGTTTDDDAFYKEAKNESGITIYNDNGTVAYMLLRRCANPMGKMPGVPPPTSQNYNLTPSVSLSPDMIEGGESIFVRAHVNNNPADTASPSTTKWSLRRSVNGGVESEVARDERSFPIGLTEWAAYTDTNTDISAGSSICFRLYVQPRSNTISSWYSSGPVCSYVGKKPKVQVWGGDLWSQGVIQTSSTVKSGRMYGSWSEYALFARDSITGMASGSALSGGLLSYGNSCNYNKLTFNNTDSTLCENDSFKGGYDTASKIIPDASASFPIASAISRNPSSFNKLDTLSSGIYTATDGTINLNSSTIPSGKWIVLNVPNNDVNIRGNLTYSNGPYSEIEDIPQVIIIAKNITIYEEVENVDAWLITRDGYLKTCNVVGDEVSKCNKLLTVNGPVITNQLYLYRTAGSGTDDSRAGGENHSGDPAEIFNLRADAYLWAYSRVSNQDRVRTVYTVELPPRF